jgi:hypothetical protein
MPTSTAININILAIERHLAALRSLHDDLTGPVITLGPSSIGRDALANYGTPAELATLIRSYTMAHSDLCERSRDAEIAEWQAALSTATGPKRAQIADYLSGLLLERHATGGVRRAA